jgi:hypothetical protein
MLVRVEVGFRINGIAFRLGGVTQWTDGRNTVGVRFLDMTERRRGELAELLAEIEGKEKATAQKEARDAKVAERRSPEELRASGPVVPNVIRTNLIEPNLAKNKAADRDHVAASRTATLAGPAAGQDRSSDRDQPMNRERRAQARHAVDSSAELFFIGVAARVKGRIVDLSPGGCRIRSIEPLAVGIFRRVEVEFRVQGLSFRLAGVTQVIHDKYTVGIRFIGLGERMRLQLVQLIEELEEAGGHGSEGERPSGTAEHRGIPPLSR